MDNIERSIFTMKKILSLVLVLIMLLSVSVALADTAPLIGKGTSPEDPLFDPALGLTLTVYTTNGWGEDSKPDFNMVKEWIEARTGLTLNFVYTSADDYLQKMNLMFVSGEHFDAFTDGGTISARGLQGMYDDGLILDISPYLEEYGQNLTRYMGKGYDYVRATDGAILSIPKRISNHRGNTPCIRGDWVEKAGMDHLPATLEELEAYFEYVKNNDVNGNGDPNDEIPFLPTGFGNMNSCLKGLFMGPDGVASKNTVGTTNLFGSFLAEDGTVKSLPDSPYFMNYLDHMRDWYQKGYIYPEFMTVTTSQVNDMVTADRVGLTAQWYSSQVRPFQAAEEADPSKHYEILPLIAVEGIDSCYSEGNEYQGVIQVSATSEHPEVVIAYWDWMLSDPDINATVWNGIQGVHWEWADKDNFVFSTLPGGESKYFKCFQAVTQFDAEDQFLYANPDNYIAIKYDKYLRDLNSDTRKYVEPFGLKVPFTKVGTDLEFMSNDGPTLLEENASSYILGTIDRAAMENAIKEYDAIYGDVYSQVYTEQYNAWLAAQ